MAKDYAEIADRLANEFGKRVAMATDTEAEFKKVLKLIVAILVEQLD